MRLFFYGTLMSDGSRGHVLAGLARRVGEASIPGDLYDVGFFPAYVPHPAPRGCRFHPQWDPQTGCRFCRIERREQIVAERRRVVGEVWEVLPGYEATALARTDAIEGYRPERPSTSLYLRRPVMARLADGEEVLVETYEWNGRVDDLARIAGGSWRSYRSGDVLPIEAA